MTKILVTGGGGFLGGEVCRQLVDLGYDVRSFSRSYYSWLDELGVESHQGDLTDAAAVARAVNGCKAVIHCGARPGAWGTYDSYYRPNVIGTQYVIEACRKFAISALIYTSSPSVVFGAKDICGLDEDQAKFPQRYLCSYPQTKMLAEKAVLAASGKDGLLTCALRPHLIWGKGDPHLLPRLRQRARTGRLMMIGQQNNKVDVIHVENAAYAHILALNKLLEGSKKVAQRAFFVGQERPVNLWQFINDLLIASGEKPVERGISYPIAYGVGASLEGVYHTFGIKTEPPMTRFLAAIMAKSHYFSHANAEKYLGYDCRISIKQGLDAGREMAMKR